MRLRILGTAAGGGLPQWNCACECCDWARTLGVNRYQDCLAVSGDGQAWYLVNASPDLRSQILATPELNPGPGPRESPIRGVLLTSAELDHTLGLLQLREATRLSVHSSAPVRAALTDDLALGPVLARYTELTWHSVAGGEEFTLAGGLEVAVVAVGSRPPRYARRASGQGWVIGYRLSDSTGRGIVYAPGLPAVSERLLDVIRPGDVVIVDGTFYAPDEMATHGGKDAAARTMGHVPVQESLPALSNCPAGVRLYTHLNNTNPLCRPDVAEARLLADAGTGVAEDGQHITW